MRLPRLRGRGDPLVVEAPAAGRRAGVDEPVAEHAGDDAVALVERIGLDHALGQPDRLAGRRPGRGQRVHEARPDPRMDDLARLELREPALPASGRDVRRGEVVRGHREQLRLQGRAEPVVGLPELAQRAVEDLDRGAEVAAGRERAAELERDLAARADLDRGGHRLAEVALEAVALAVGRLRDAQLVQDRPAVVRVGRLRRARGAGSGRRPRLLRSPPHGGRPTAAPPRAPGRRRAEGAAGAGRPARSRPPAPTAAGPPRREAPGACSGGICS